MSEPKVEFSYTGNGKYELKLNCSQRELMESALVYVVGVQNAMRRNGGEIAARMLVTTLAAMLMSGKTPPSLAIDRTEYEKQSREMGE